MVATVVYLYKISFAIITQNEERSKCSSTAYIHEEEETQEFKQECMFASCDRCLVSACAMISGTTRPVSVVAWGLMAELPGFPGHGISLHLGIGCQYSGSSCMFQAPTQN